MTETYHFLLKNFILVFLSSFFLVICTYILALDAWFVLDDYAWLHSISLEQLLAYFTQSWGHGVAYRPLMRISFFIDYNLFGENPIGWHLHSYIIHAINSALLFLIIQLLTKKYYLAFLTAILFAIAPWGHDNIAWISARTHSLASLFYLTALYFALWHLIKQRLYFLFAATIFLIMGLMTYEATVSFALICTALALFFRKKFNIQVPKIIYVFFYYSLVTGLFLLLRYFVLDSIGVLNQNHGNYFYGLLFNLGIIQQIFIFEYKYISATLLISFLACFIVQAYQNKLLETIYGLLFMALLAFITYLPFSQIAGVAYRFLYLTQIAYVYVIAYAIYTVIQFEYNLIKKTLFSFILLASILVAVVLASIQISKEWHVAGQISETIPKDFKKLNPELPQNMNFVFQNIPNSYKRAGVYLTYFHVALLRQYPQAYNNQIFRAEELLRDPAFLSNRYDKPAKYFYFTGNELIEIKQIQWEILNGLREKIAITKNNFDAKTYLAFYPDIARVYSEKTAWQHWTEHGKKEGRIALPILKSTTQP